MRTAHLRLPALRCADDHHPDLHAHTADPCATSAASRSMIRGICGCPYRASALHRSTPIADGFALRCANVVSPPVRHRRIPPRTAGIGHLSDVRLGLIGQITSPSRTASNQIPIDSSLSQKPKWGSARNGPRGTTRTTSPDPRACYALSLFLNCAASSEPPVALPALYECAPTPASLPP